MDVVRQPELPQLPIAEVQLEYRPRLELRARTLAPDPTTQPRT